jgi:hypothetical protein
MEYQLIVIVIIYSMNHNFLVQCSKHNLFWHEANSEI